MYKKTIENDLKKAVEELGLKSTDIVVYISENVLFGDYTTNVALQMAKLDVDKKYQSPRDIANAIADKFGHPSYLERLDIAGPGFINFFLKDSALLKIINESDKKTAKKEKADNQKFPKKILVEFSQPNTHKAFHIGHLRGLTTGESISRLLEYQGNEVFRVTYGGDIGPHVAKALWGILQLRDEFLEVRKLSLREKAEFLGKAYSLGSTKYEEDAGIKSEVDQINKDIYQKKSDLIVVWEETKKWSIGYFDSIYAQLGTLFDAEIWESEIQELGTQLVQDHKNDVFKEDQGAIIFPGEKYKLHNRVFITSGGYPTYEAKELGLALKEWELFPFDQALHIIGNEQSEYFKVVTKAVELVEPQLLNKRSFIGYGMVNLSTGKMSSRKGNIITGEGLINDVSKMIQESYKTSLSESQLQKIAVAAIRFSFLKVSKEADIAFDINQAVSLHGDSGPYLQYTYARINSILEKAKEIKLAEIISNTELEPEEREVLRHLDYFESVTERAAKELSPNDLASYLLTLAKSFNQFYEKHPVLGSKKQDLRLKMAIAVAEKLKLGCYLLGFEVLEKM